MWERLFLDVVSGKNTWWAVLLRLCFLPMSWVYGLLVGIRNSAFRYKLRAIRRLEAPVISIGNLSVGGTGKTPLVAWVVHQLVQKGYKPGIVSRGYRAMEDEKTNDEFILLSKACPDTPHAQNPDRFAAAHTLISQQQCNVIVMDDGFQHRQLGRELDVVLLDATQDPFTNHLLPRGLLREPFASLIRADFIIITRSSSNPQRTESLKQRCQKEVPDVPVAFVDFEPVCLVDHEGNHFELSEIDPSKVAYFCGIGNPRSFKKTIEQLGWNSDDERFHIFPDHYHYALTDQEELEEWGSRLGCDILITTEKDIVRYPLSPGGSCKILALRVKPVFLNDEDHFMDDILRVVNSADTTKNEEEISSGNSARA